MRMIETVIATIRHQAIRKYGEEYKVWELHSHIKQFTTNQLLTINLFHPPISEWAAQSTLSPLMCLVLTHHASTKFNITFSRKPVWITFPFRWINHPMGCGLPYAFVHGISQARILEWVAISFSDFLGSQYIKQTHSKFFSIYSLARDYLFWQRVIQKAFLITYVNSLFLHT